MPSPGSRSGSSSSISSSSSGSSSGCSSDGRQAAVRSLLKMVSGYADADLPGLTWKLRSTVGNPDDNNLDLHVELVNPSIARTGITEEEAAFEAVFFANYDFTKTDSPNVLATIQGTKSQVKPFGCT